MQYTIQHELPGRLRVKLAGRVPETDVDALTRVLLANPVIDTATVYPRTGSVAVTFDAVGSDTRTRVENALASVDRAAVDDARRDCTVALAPRTNGLLLDIATLLGGHLARRWFLPAPFSTIYTAWSYRHGASFSCPWTTRCVRARRVGYRHLVSQTRLANCRIYDAVA